jgi:hypothetical protein
MEILKLFLEFLITPVAIFGILAWLLQKLFEKWISKDLEKYKSDRSQELETFKSQHQEKLEGSKTKLQANLETYKTSLQNELESHKAKLNAEYSKKQTQFQTKFSAFHQKQFELAGELFGLFTDLRYKIYRFSQTQVLYNTAVSELDDELTKFEEVFSRNRFYFDEELCGKIDEQRKFLRAVLTSFKDCELVKVNLKANPTDGTIQVQLKEAKSKMMSKFSEIKESYTNDETLLEPEFRKLVSTENSETSLENTN